MQHASTRVSHPFIRLPEQAAAMNPGAERTHGRISRTDARPDPSTDAVPRFRDVPGFPRRAGGTTGPVSGSNI